MPEKLVAILACPLCKAGVRVEETRISCKRPECGLVFPIRDGIPVFLIDEAERPCPKCGTSRNWDARTDELACPSCGTRFRYVPES